MITTLGGILSKMKVMKRPVSHLLQEGLSRDSVVSELSKVGLEAPEEVVDLYMWRNGTDIGKADTLDDVYFFPGYYLLSLSDAKDLYAELVDVAEWDKMWFPVFASGGGDFYAVNTDPSRKYEVMGILKDDPETLVEFVNLDAMCHTIKECYDRGIFFVDDDGSIEMDDDEFAEVASELNPGLDVYE